MVVDYYKILEVNEKSSTADIKKAYRRLALKWHPDKNLENLEEANRRFKEISEAYEILSDEKKRRMYDQYGPEGPNVRQNSRRHHMDPDMDFFAFHPFRDPEDVFREFFGDSSPLSSFFEAVFEDDEGFVGRRGTHRHHSLSPFSLFPPFDNLLSDFGGGNIFSSSISTSHGGPVSKRTVTSTRFTNGKKITTQRVIENGKETVLQFENDILKSKTVNGVSQGLTYS